MGWNVVGTIVSILAAVAAGSVALAGFGLDSLIEIGASTVVIWRLHQRDRKRQRRALRLIGGSFIALALYIAVQAIYTLVTAQHPHHSILGIAWTAVTCLTMLALAAGKASTGKALDDPVLQTEGRVTLIDEYLAGAILTGLASMPRSDCGGPTPSRDSLSSSTACARAATPCAKHDLDPHPLIREREPVYPAFALASPVKVAPFRAFRQQSRTSPPPC